MRLFLFVFTLTCVMTKHSFRHKIRRIKKTFEEATTPLKLSPSQLSTPFTETSIGRSNVGIDYTSDPSVEIVKTKKKPEKINFAEYNRRFLSQGKPNFGRLSPSSSITLLANYNYNSESQVSDMNSENNKVFFNTRIGSPPSLGLSNSIDTRRAEEEATKDVPNDDSQFYGNYFQNYFANMKSLYGNSKDPEDLFINPQLKKIYTNTPLSYSLSYEDKTLKNIKARPKPIFSSDLKSPDCVCSPGIQICDCDEIQMNGPLKADTIVLPFYQPSIGKEDCEEEFEDCTCGDDYCEGPKDGKANKDGKEGCDNKKPHCKCCGKDVKKKNNPETPKNSTNSSNSSNSSNSTGNGSGSNIKANINNANALSNTNNLNRIGNLSTNSYHTHHYVHHVNNYFYGMNFKENPEDQNEISKQKYNSKDINQILQEKYAKTLVLPPGTLRMRRNNSESGLVIPISECKEMLGNESKTNTSSLFDFNSSATTDMFPIIHIHNYINPELASQIGNGDINITTTIPKENLQRVMDNNQYMFAKSKLAETENISMAMLQAYKNTFTADSLKIKEKVLNNEGISVSQSERVSPNFVNEQVIVEKSDNFTPIESSRRRRRRRLRRRR